MIPLFLSYPLSVSIFYQLYLKNISTTLSNSYIFFCYSWKKPSSSFTRVLVITFCLVSLFSLLTHWSLFSVCSHRPTLYVRSCSIYEYICLVICQILSFLCSKPPMESQLIQMKAKLFIMVFKVLHNSDLLPPTSSFCMTLSSVSVPLLPQLTSPFSLLQPHLLPGVSGTCQAYSQLRLAPDLNASSMYLHSWIPHSYRSLLKSYVLWDAFSGQY